MTKIERCPGLRFFQLSILCFFAITSTYTLKCRTEDGPSDAQLKRVARNCMRKIGENMQFWSTNPTSSNSGDNGYARSYNNYHDQQQQQQQQQHHFNYGIQNANADKHDENDEDDYEEYGKRNRNHNNYNRNYNHYGNYDRNMDLMQQRNRDRLQMNRSKRSSSGNVTNSSSIRNNDRGHNLHGNQQQKSSSLSSSSSSSSSSSNGNNGNGNKNNNSTYDSSSCVVHCFFEEMNMLNVDNYPDKNKVTYTLTKEIRDRELRNFYTETIKDCFHYMDTQRRHDKCQFSRDLISCMTEYAKANCDDWQDNNLLFN